MNTIIFKIYKINENKETIYDKDYSFNVDERLADIKKRILKESFNDEFNKLDLENISDRIYKDFGKLSFEKGLLPCTIDNYKLIQFTNENRTFSFIAKPSNVDIKVDVNKKINVQSGFLKKIVKSGIKKNNENMFSYNEDFPPLK